MDITFGLWEILEVRPTLMNQIGSRQREDSKLMKIMGRVSQGGVSRYLQCYSTDSRGWLRRDGRLCVPCISDLLRVVLEEAHHSRMTIHLGGDKMYRDMKSMFY